MTIPKGGNIDAAPASSTEAIWKEFRERLMRFVTPRAGSEEDAEDIVQDVFRSIHAHLDGLQDAERLESWIFQITRNRLADHHRRRGRRPSPLPDDLAREEETTASSAAVRELASCLRGLAETLPEKYREAIRLTELEGLTQAAAAESLGISLSGAKSRVQRGREKLKEKLEACCRIEHDRRGNILDYRPHDPG
ncbi:MAG: RNA polymerase sigma factor SigZ [Planctomycetota bacterium]